jgi:hypothetical protein
MLISTVWFDNGASAIAAYGCDAAELDGSYSADGPWTPWIGLAARQGDAARGAFLACFDSTAASPALTVVKESFEGEGPVSGLGRRTAIFETAEPAEASCALGLLAGMPSMWDAPEQGDLWRCAREGREADLRKGLALHPEWARGRWSIGSSLGELCARMGDWACCQAVSEAAGRFGAEEARGLSRSVASCASDAYDYFALGAAPKVLCRAWAAGLRLDREAWIDAFDVERRGRDLASKAWADGEAAWLASGGGAGSARASKRL